MYMYHTAHFTIAEYCIITPTTTPPHYRYIPPPLPSSFPPSSPSWLPYIPPPLLLSFLPTSIPPLSLPPPSLQFTCTTGLLSSPDAVTVCWSVWGRRQGVVLRLNWLVQFDCIPLWENLISQHHLTSPSLRGFLLLPLPQQSSSTRETCTCACSRALYMCTHCSQGRAFSAYIHDCISLTFLHVYGEL